MKENEIYGSRTGGGTDGHPSPGPFTGISRLAGMGSDRRYKDREAAGVLVDLGKFAPKRRRWQWREIKDGAHRLHYLNLYAGASKMVVTRVLRGFQVADAKLRTSLAISSAERIPEARKVTKC